jgi:predicted nucleic acid-binding Zn ribbon protein
MHVRSCPVCQAALSSPRTRYCSDACRQRAYRLRREPAAPLDIIALESGLRRLGQRVAHTVYECPSCDARYLGEQRCADCGVFCRRVGPGGPCPACDEAVTVDELLGLPVPG